MLDHIGLSVGDFARSQAFYTAALKPLELSLIMQMTPDQTGGGSYAGFGTDGKPFFWIGDSKASSGPVHVAFAASSRALVDAFYAAAIAAGGTDNGAPGLRPHYHSDYYGAFVFDPDGNNVEAVCHAPA